MLRPHAYQPPEDGLPPQEVRIVDLHVEPWPEDGRRVRIHLEITPFIERPDLEVIIADKEDHEISSISIVESIDAKMTFTMHIRGPELQDTYTLKASVLYADIGIVDKKMVPFETIKKEDNREDP